MGLLTGCVRATSIPETLLVPVDKPSVPARGSSDRVVAQFILEQNATIDKANAQIQAIAEIVK